MTLWIDTQALIVIAIVVAVLRMLKIAPLVKRQHEEQVK